MNLKIGRKINQWSHHVRQEDLNSWSKILNDPNPIHFDANAVKKIGQGDKCINQGPADGWEETRHAADRHRIAA